MAGLPYTLIDLFVEKLKTVTAEQVQEVARKNTWSTTDSPLPTSILSRCRASPLRVLRREHAMRSNLARLAAFTLLAVVAQIGARDPADPALGNAARRARLLRREPRPADARRERRHSGRLRFRHAREVRRCQHDGEHAAARRRRHGRERDRAQARGCRARSFRAASTWIAQGRACARSRARTNGDRRSTSSRGFLRSRNFRADVLEREKVRVDGRD